VSEPGGESGAATDETQKSRLADPRLLGARDDAGALVTSRSRGDLLRRFDEHLVAAGHGLALRAEAQLSRTIASML